jgi:hypothetical protein
MGGYEWLDGAVVSTEPEDKATTVSEDVLSIGPVDDPLGPRSFSRVNEQLSLICHIPDDATTEWVSLAYEAACMLAVRSSSGVEGAVADMDDVSAQQQNRRIGERICRDVENRFGLVPSSPVSSTDVSAQVGSVEGAASQTALLG